MAFIIGAYFCVHLSSLKYAPLFSTALSTVSRRTTTTTTPEPTSKPNAPTVIRLTSIYGRHTEDMLHTLCSLVNSL